MRFSMKAATVAVAVLVLAGCGSSPPSANTLACQHFAQQRDWVKAHQATLTLADAATIGGWVQDDADESAGALHRDFAAYSRAYQSLTTFGSDTKKAEAQAGAARQRITTGCKALGVTV